MVEGDFVMEANVEARPVIRVQAPTTAEPKEGAVPADQHELKMTARDVNLWYGEKQALFDVNRSISSTAR